MSLIIGGLGGIVVERGVSELCICKGLVMIIDVEI